jgi:hypothetical protein
MRETGIEPAMEEAGADVSPERVVISSGRNGPPLLWGAGPSAGGPGARARLRTEVALAPEIGQALIRELPGRATKDT